MQVRASNADGDGAWSDSGTGTTGPTIDYDADDDGLIEISSVAQLNAVRWDLDGDGTANTNNTEQLRGGLP